jgi:hypothetical protein
MEMKNDESFDLGAQLLRDQAEQGPDKANAIPWPEPLHEAAFHGIAGEYVKMIEPHTEADTAAILMQFLVAFGNCVGEGPYFQVEADRHGVNEFAVIVGDTAKGRKGTSWGHIRETFKSIDAAWTVQHIQSGLSSGEGLIMQVRDPVSETDDAPSDKRLLVIEPEFAQLLAMMKREGNTISPVIRQAWDRETLAIMTKHSPARATGTHVSLICHITQEEQRRRMAETEAFNGFANRFIWICARRSKLLPEGGNLDSIDMTDFHSRLFEVVSFSRTVGRLQRDEESRKIWIAVYPALSDAKSGLLGAVVSRSEAHVLRLSCIYALLDSSELVRKAHLLAALAVWDYAEASARYIFGDKAGDDIEDRLFDALRIRENGMTRTDIHNLFSRHVNTARIDDALTALMGKDAVFFLPEETGGRTAKRFYAAKKAKKAN